MSPEDAEALAPRSVVVFGAVVGFIGAAAWFLPRLGQLPLDAHTPEGLLHLLGLLVLPAAAAATFAVVLGSFSARYGGVPVAAVLLLLNVFAQVYTAMRAGQPLVADVWFVGCTWGVALAAFAVASGMLMSASTDRRARPD